ncbi:MAG TPA: DUF4097 family beta strand repeat-containing protein [Rubrobacter sp.]|nr:DUF4097 family beta strand repeat-containing protein [Rubrobacter sp.]
MSGARRERFEVDGRIRVELNLPSGRAAFLPGGPEAVEVTVEGRQADEFVVERVGDGIVLRTPGSARSRWDSFDLTVRMPAGGELEVRAASADVRAEVELGSLKVDVASGEVVAGGVAGEATVRSASGDVELGDVAGDLAVNTASGDVRVRQIGGRAMLNSASGDVRVGEALGVLAVSSQSGDVKVGRYAGEDLECGSTSGNVRIGLPPGLNLDVDVNTVSGEIRSDFAPEEGNGATARLRVKTISGDIILHRASER